MSFDHHRRRRRRSLQDAYERMNTRGQNLNILQRERQRARSARVFRIIQRHRPTRNDARGQILYHTRNHPNAISSNIRSYLGTGRVRDVVDDFRNVFYPNNGRTHALQSLIDRHDIGHEIQTTMPSDAQIEEEVENQIMTEHDFPAEETSEILRRAWLYTC